MTETTEAAILAHKHYEEPSVFRPENLLREARRQKKLKKGAVPAVCVLDPDGDIVNYLGDQDHLEENPYWSCYHSKLYNYQLGDREIGLIPCIVGASYAVLVAEQLFVSGCELLISITSAGIINEPRTPKRFALISQALRDEGTSYHYLAPEQTAQLAPALRHKLGDQELWFQAKSWTTDAPYRETPSAIEAQKKEAITCVEMEAAALYAFAEAQDQAVICFAHLTNTMAQEEGDFEKGAHFGSLESLELLRQSLAVLEQSRP